MATNKSNLAKKSEPVAGNRLIGWLVSYADDVQGRAFQIHAGRSFISSQTVGSDAVILLEGKAICAPHAALNASRHHRLMIQDVFSQHGTFLTKRGSEKEVQVHGPTEISHGDWLRIGESTRFQVCLIDGPGSK